MNRDEHLAWCKERAHEYLDRGDVLNAMTSMGSDLNKHLDTKDHPGINIGVGLLFIGSLSTVPKMRKFIDGFH